jgi:methylmalonyl-CoA mutase C-terminal domain/subunit
MEHGTERSMERNQDRNTERRIRVLLFKPGLDGHWRGIMAVSRALVEAGMEVIFEGHKTLDGIIETAIQEDVDIIGLSVLSGSHLEWTRMLMDALDKEGCKGDYLILVGGVFPPEDHAVMREMGVDGVFGPGTDTADIVAFIHNLKAGSGLKNQGIHQAEA